VIPQIAYVIGISLTILIYNIRSQNKITYHTPKNHIEVDM